MPGRQYSPRISSFTARRTDGTDIGAILILTVVSLAASLLIVTQLLLRRLRSVLMRLPRSEQTLTMREIQTTHLNGISLKKLLILGAVLTASAVVQAISLAFIIGMDGNEANLEAIDAYDIDWRPVYVADLSANPAPWTDKTYAAARAAVEKDVSDADRRAEALKRLETLACGNSDVQLASCNPKTVPPAVVRNWRKQFECKHMKEPCAVADEQQEDRELARALGDIICSDKAHSIYIVRALMENGRMSDAGRESRALSFRIMNDTCPVSKDLNQGDRAKLQKIASEASSAG